MLKIKQITDEAKWLEDKKKYVSSTESSALYGLNPWKTHFELWNEKHNNYDASLSDDNFLAFGRLMEEPISQMVLIENPEWEIENANFFAYDNSDKIASSFDRVVTLPNGDKGLLEIKSTSYRYFKEKFTEIDNDIEAPTQYEVQMQHQLEVIRKYDFIIMAVFIADTRQLKYLQRGRDEEMGQEIRKAVKDFWQTTVPPEPDFSRDKALIAKLAPSANPDYVLDATKDTRITELATMYKSEKELEKQSKENADKFYAELLHKAGKNRFIWTENHKISCSDIKATSNRSGYKRLTITEIKK